MKDHFSYDEFTIITEFAFPVDHFRESTAVRSLFVWRISFQLSQITSVVSGRSLVIKAVFTFPEHFFGHEFYFSATDLFGCESARVLF